MPPAPARLGGTQASVAPTVSRAAVPQRMGPLPQANQADERDKRGIKSCHWPPTSLVSLSHEEGAGRLGSHLAEASKYEGPVPAAPEDLPALAADVLRECQLHVGGPGLSADLQDLRGEKGWMPGLGGGCGLAISSPPSPREEGQTPCFPPAFA